MTPEQLQELEEKAKLWDSLGKSFLTMLGFQLRQHKDVVFDYRHTPNDQRPFTYFSSPIISTSSDSETVIKTIENTSNASTFIDVLKEESEEMVDIPKSELVRRCNLIMSEPDGIVRETMINNLLM